MKRALAAAAGILALATTSTTQEEPSSGLFERLVILADGQVVVQAGDDAAEPPEEDVETERQKRLKTLKFDRRPSAILKAWSTPPEPVEEEAPAEEATAVEEAEATVAAAPPTDPASEGEGEAAAEAGGPPEEDAPPEKTEAELAAEAAAETARLEAEKKALDAEAESFQRDVTLGNWEEVTEYLAGLTEAEAKAGYEQLLKSLVEGPAKAQGQFARFAEKNFFAPEDVRNLAAAAPHELESSHLTNLGKILRSCVDEGSLIEKCIELFHEGLAMEGLPLERSQVARIVIEAGFPVEAGEFLPDPNEAIEANDRATLNLLARHYLAKHGEEKKSDFLRRAWTVTQAVLADGEVEDEDKEEALKRAVDLAPRIREELGQAWLDESFTARPQRGMEILSVIGSASSTGMFAQARNSAQRFKSLELQTTAADAVLAAAPELAAEWSAVLNLLAANWLREAVFTYGNDQSTSLGPSLRRDVYGNFFYYNYNFRSSVNRSIPEPITTDKVLDIRPSDAWLELVVDGLRPKFEIVTAQLLLKVNEEDQAFPYIERLAETNPDRAKELAEEFLRVWARNHNPNTQSSRTSSYMFIYGFEQRSNAIPLTRSKQERNLTELAKWVRRLNKLPIEDLDEELIANAFTAAHSTAEVYRIETIERVFGAMDQLEPKTMAELVQKMRSNLVGVWRQPAVQKEKQTRRRQKDIQNEVLRGYEVARDVVDRGLQDHPDDWSLVLAGASVLHDENNYRQEIANSTEFAGRRQEAFEGFQRAANLYRAQVGELDEEEETTKAFETWFYASLGACDLNAIDHEKQPATAQLERIRESLFALPEEVAERHVGMFANTLFTRMSSVNPAVKFRYVSHGLDIVGDHERAREARTVFEYYEDLVTEIRLETRIDGPDRVGYGEPFGLFVDIRHTREIERESGGFSKYLINQNDQRFAWNYGRPTENYRDKFEEAAREALREHFEVLSVTFNHPETHSRADEEYGWRITPYAYLLLKARGPEVDRVPPLRLDLDFLDTTGYAVLPAESPALVIDATSEEPAERVFTNLELVQTLDERQADEGKLVLEVQATALGLIPDLEEILDLAPEQFDVVSTEDQGLSVSKFDEEGDEIAVVSERTWMITMNAREGLEELPDTFTFGSALADGAEMEYQRFVDADLKSVEPIVSLEEHYGKRSLAFLLGWAVAVLGMIAVGGAGFVALRRTRRTTGPTVRFRMPESISPFTVIGLLREIEAENGVTELERTELLAHIERLESFYFEDDQRETPDLRAIAETWVRRVN